MMRRFFTLSRPLLTAAVALVAVAAHAQSYVDPVLNSLDAPPSGSGLANMNLVTLLRSAGIGSYVYADPAINGGFATDQILDRNFLSNQIAPTSMTVLLSSDVRSAESWYFQTHRVGWYQTATPNIAPTEAMVHDVLWEATAPSPNNTTGTARLSATAIDFAGIDASQPWYLRLSSDPLGGPVYGYDGANPGGTKQMMFLQERDLAGNIIADSYIIAFEDISGGGDRDYNDMVLRVTGTSRTPEPGTLALCALAGAAGVAIARRKKRA